MVCITKWFTTPTFITRKFTCNIITCTITCKLITCNFTCTPQSQLRDLLTRLRRRFTFEAIITFTFETITISKSQNHNHNHKITIKKITFTTSHYHNITISQQHHNITNNNHI